MAFIYTQADLKGRINGGIQGKIDILVDSQDTMNSAVRDLKAKVAIRSAKRRASLSPNLFNGIFPYSAPSDIQGHRIIDIPQQAKRPDGEWQLTTPEEFDRVNGAKKGLMAIDDYNGTKILKLASTVDSNSLLISEMDSVSSWVVFGDAEDLEADDADFIKGAGSLKFGISSAGGTTAGVQNSSLTTFSLVDYLDGTSAIFIWHKINSTTNITNYILRVGTDSSNYYSKTITTQADGTAFVNGWNLLKFDLTSLSETGTVTDSTCNFAAVYMTKATGKVSETDYKFDWMVLKKGVPHYVRYYSKYGWQSSAAAYKENSTAVDDLLVADTDEFELFVKNGIIWAKREIGYPSSEVDKDENNLKLDLAVYTASNPDESKVMMTDYYEY